MQVKLNEFSDVVAAIIRLLQVTMVSLRLVKFNVKFTLSQLL